MYQNFYFEKWFILQILCIQLKLKLRLIKNAYEKQLLHPKYQREIDSKKKEHWQKTWKLKRESNYFITFALL